MGKGKPTTENRFCPSQISKHGMNAQVEKLPIMQCTCEFVLCYFLISRTKASCYPLTQFGLIKQLESVVFLILLSSRLLESTKSSQNIHLFLFILQEKPIRLSLSVTKS